MSADVLMQCNESRLIKDLPMPHGAWIIALLKPKSKYAYTLSASRSQIVLMSLMMAERSTNLSPPGISGSQKRKLDFSFQDVYESLSESHRLVLGWRRSWAF